MQEVRAQEIRDLLVANGVDLGDHRFSGATRITIGTRLSRRANSLDRANEDADPTLATQKAATRPRQQSGYRLVTEAPPRVPRPRRFLGASQVNSLKEELKQAISDFVRESVGDDLLYTSDLDLLSRNAGYLAQATDQIAVAASAPVAIGRQRFLVSFSTPDGPVRFPVFAEVRRSTPVVVAVRPIARGATITASDLRLQPLADGTRVRGDDAMLFAVEDAIGLEAGQTIRVGQPLTEQTCLPPMLVQRGDLVTVVSGGGGSASGGTFKARREGRLGEAIEVESIDDDKQQLTARVVGLRELAVVTVGVGDGDYLSQLRGSGRIR